MRTRMIAVSALLVLTGCSAVPTAPEVDKAGEPVGPVTLRAWTPESTSRPTGMQLTAFAAAVQRLSDGAITITTTYDAEDGLAGPDQTVIEGVQDGDYDIGLAASRAFSSVGIDSLRVLTAPFEIQTDAVAAAVASDEKLTGQMLGGLTGAGLTGMAIIPETIRHPFGATKAILGPDDYQGALLRSLPSNETYAAFTALGAEPGYWNDGIWATSEHPAIPIVESSFAFAAGVMDGPATGTGNVAFFPRMNVLFANSKAAAKLTADQRDVLARAATEARGDRNSHGSSDAADAALYCSYGGRVVLADGDDLAALHEAVAPYLAEQAKDPTIADQLDRIRAMAASTPEPEPVRACQPPTQPGGDLEPWPATDAASPLDGRYRVEVTDADLAAAQTSEKEWAENHGVFTWEITNGRMTLHQVAPNALRKPTETFTIVTRGPQAMLMGFRDDGSAQTARDILWVATWSRDADGTLRFTDYQPGLGALAQDRAQWFAHPFTPLY